MKNNHDHLGILKYCNVQDVKNILFALSKFDYCGAIASLMNALFDLYDIYTGLVEFHLSYKNFVHIKTAMIRFVGNFLLGIVRFFPFITFVSLLLLNPFIIPSISLGIVAANFYKTYVLMSNAKFELSIDKTVYVNNKNENTLNCLQQSQDNQYQTQRDCMITGLLMFGSLLSIVGVIFPPIVIVGIVITMIGGVIGILDKKFCFGKRFFKTSQEDENYCHPDENKENMKNNAIGTQKTRKLSDSYGVIRNRMKSTPPYSIKRAILPENKPRENIIVHPVKYKRSIRTEQKEFVGTTPVSTFRV